MGRGRSPSSSSSDTTGASSPSSSSSQSSPSSTSRRQSSSVPRGRKRRKEKTKTSHSARKDAKTVRRKDSSSPIRASKRGRRKSASPQSSKKAKKRENGRVRSPSSCSSRDKKDRRDRRRENGRRSSRRRRSRSPSVSRNVVESQVGVRGSSSSRKRSDKKLREEISSGAKNSSVSASSSLAATGLIVQKDAPIGRTGGVYIPPFKLARIQKEITDKTSAEYQKQSWEALRKSVNGLVNKVNVGNIAELVQDLFKENLIRSRGLFARAVIRAQLASPGFTNVYGALVAVVNSKLPELGELILHRVVLQFRRSYRRNDKVVCLACLTFLGHLVNQRVAHELLALQIAGLLLEDATDDSVECCVGFIQQVGQVLSELSRRGFDAVFERLRGILSEGTVERKTQYTVEKLFSHWKNKFAEFPGVVPELDLVDEDDQITHELDLLDDTIKGQESLNIFKASDPEVYAIEERQWAALSKEILGERDPDDPDGGGESSSDSEDSEAEAEEEEEQPKETIVDYSEQELINLRKNIYLCIMSSLNFEECVHKMMKLNIKEGQEMEVCTMLLDCSAMERTFQKFFALQADRLCRLRPAYQNAFSECLRRQYKTVHRLETNKLRNTAKFFALLFYSDSLSWTLMDTFVITEESTTSSGRIFIKILFQELCEHLGLEELNNRLHDDGFAASYQGLFPIDHPKNTRFAINFFTAIGLGGITDELRLFLQNSMQKVANS